MNQSSEIYYRLLEDDGGVLHKYRITESDYNKYEKEGTKWITFYCRADVKESPNDGMNPQPWLEINLPIEDADYPSLDAGSQLTGTAYNDEKHFNLTNVYYYSHDSFEDPIIEILGKSGTNLKVKITGDSAEGPISLFSNFIYNPKRTRSFN